MAAACGASGIDSGNIDAGKLMFNPGMTPWRVHNNRGIMDNLLPNGNPEQQKGNYLFFCSGMLLSL
jgi:hypothetical protein